MKVIEAFTKTPLQRATDRAAHFRALLESRENARKALEAKRDAALEAMPDGDPRELTKIRDGLHDIGLKIAETQAGLQAAERRIAEEEAKADAAKAAARWEEVRSLCEQRRQVAERLQAAAAAVGAAYAEMHAVTSKLLTLAPADKPHRVAQEWHEEIISAFDTRLDALTGGTFGKEGWTLRYNTRAEYLEREPDLAAKAQRQHERLLNQQPKDANGHEPAAA